MSRTDFLKAVAGSAALAATASLNVVSADEDDDVSAPNLAGVQHRWFIQDPVLNSLEILGPNHATADFTYQIYDLEEDAEHIGEMFMAWDIVTDQPIFPNLGQPGMFAMSLSSTDGEVVLDHGGSFKIDSAQTRLVYCDQNWPLLSGPPPPGHLVDTGLFAGVKTSSGVGNTGQFAGKTVTIQFTGRLEDDRTTLTTVPGTYFEMALVSVDTCNGNGNGEDDDDDAD